MTKLTLSKRRREGSSNTKNEFYTTIKMALKINAVDITASIQKISKHLYRLRCLCSFSHFVRLLSNRDIRDFFSLMITNVIMCSCDTSSLTLWFVYCCKPALLLLLLLMTMYSLNIDRLMITQFFPPKFLCFFFYSCVFVRNDTSFRRMKLKTERPHRKK